jgi:hypothetical protein
MRQVVAFVALLIAGAVLTMGVALIMVSCTPARTAQDDAMATAYAADLLRCVHESATRDESRACRAEVEVRYASLRDGGSNQ